ncbi:glycosyltransferase [Acinetobacter rathckeae]|uniref:glycosyltransferase n=1 Tax=Acinetobacter rathckeae TaxID=2605272 RepID=UPI0018A2F291|nr:glycosyltransferase [Acinetobacter rathckeae]MBF7687841.1 glycosyltransferase [Acinetobacter rathckeae]MBF7687936.1 glycosyltransferase [Acinetobacter rathckeae]MBF7696011.1 glycosyltransferase [Acinetobacter rathckeae]
MEKQVSIALSMIVKNEAPIIIHTLEHLQSHFNIDTWVICDTGSTDQTVALVQDYLLKHQLKGQVLTHVWQDFAHNRNLALEACRDQADYILFWDADDRIEGQLCLPSLDLDAYALKLKEENGLIHYRYLLVQNDLACMWHSKLHEFIAFAPDTKTAMIMGDYHVRVGHFGARSQNKNKYHDDVKHLSLFYAQEQDVFLKARYAYYSGLSCLNIVQYLQAKQWFERRLSYTQEYPNIVFNIDEEYESYLKLGQIAGHFKQYEDAVSYWKIAIQRFTTRFDAPYELSKLYLQQGQYQLAYDYAQQAKVIVQQHSTSMAYYQGFTMSYGIDLQLLNASLALQKPILAYQHILPLLEKKPLSNQFYCDLITVISQLKIQCVAEQDKNKQQLILSFLTLPQFKNNHILKARQKLLQQFKAVMPKL